MTLAIGNSRSRAASFRGRGFTLLEMIVTLAIIAVLTTFFSVSFLEASADDDLRASAAALRTSAQKASRLSEAHGGDFFLVIDRRGFGLGETERRDDFSDSNFDHDLPAGIDLKMRRFGDTEWLQPNRFLWNFPANGLCEPLDIRLEKDKSYVEMSFNALTGRVARESSHYP